MTTNPGYSTLDYALRDVLSHAHSRAKEWNLGSPERYHPATARARVAADFLFIQNVMGVSESIYRAQEQYSPRKTLRLFRALEEVQTPRELVEAGLGGVFQKEYARMYDELMQMSHTCKDLGDSRNIEFMFS